MMSNLEFLPPLTMVALYYLWTYLATLQELGYGTEFSSQLGALCTAYWTLKNCTYLSLFQSGPPRHCRPGLDWPSFIAPRC